MTNAILNEAVHKKGASWLEIDLGRLKGNLSYIRSRLDPGTGVLAVVKANGYGHGMSACAKALEDRVDYFGVSDVREAVTLREKGILRPVLIFGFVDEAEVPLLVKYGLTLSISDGEQARRLNEILLDEGPSGADRLKVHLKIDSGMSRLGFSFRTAAEEILALKDLPMLELEGIFTHFAVSDKRSEDFTQVQIGRFHQVLERLRAGGLDFKWRHAANSGGILNFTESHFNLVRPGITLYGLYDDGASNHPLEPVMTWKTTVKLIRRLREGDTVSYNRRFRAERPTRLAVLPVGYSHGYPIALSGKSSVIIRGTLYPVVGQVSMDYLMVDVGGHSPVKEGDEATLIGRSDGAEVSAVALARLAGTISYEIVTRLGPLLGRFYHE